MWNGRKRLLAIAKPTIMYKLYFKLKYVVLTEKSIQATVLCSSDTSIELVKPTSETNR